MAIEGVMLAASKRERCRSTSREVMVLTEARGPLAVLAGSSCSGRGGSDGGWDWPGEGGTAWFSREVDEVRLAVSRLAPRAG